MYVYIEREVMPTYIYIHTHIYIYIYPQLRGAPELAKKTADACFDVEIEKHDMYMCVYIYINCSAFKLSCLS